MTELCCKRRTRELACVYRAYPTYFVAKTTESQCSFSADVFNFPSIAPSFNWKPTGGASPSSSPLSFDKCEIAEFGFWWCRRGRQSAVDSRGRGDRGRVGRARKKATRRRRRWSPVQLPPLPSTGDGAVAPISPICVLWALDRCDAPADEVIPPPARGGVPSPRIRQPRPRGVGHTESRDVGQRRRGAVSDTRKS